MTHNIKHLIINCIALSISAGINAAPRSLAQARALASQKASQLGLTISQSQPRRVKGKAVVQNDNCDYYVFNNDANKGFTIISGDDDIPAVIGYTTDGHFDADNLPDGLRYYLECYTNTMDKSAQYYSSQGNARLKASATHKAVSPLVTSKWYQLDPYNRLCPLYDGTNRSVTGCVATSMAQLMYFYRNPVPQYSGIPGYTTTSCQIKIPAITGERTYDWEKMQDTYDDTSSDEACNAVAKLMYHCGVSAVMDYAEGSGTYTILAWWAMKSYFGYDCQYAYSGDYTRSDWLDMLNCELDSLRPFYIGGNDGIYGHAFLCDGRDADGLHHINWGWAGACDGYFNLSLLNPYDQTAPGYNKGNEVIVGIKLPKGYEVYTEFRKLRIQYNDYNSGFAGFRPGTAPGFCDQTAYDNCKAVLDNVNQKLTDGVGTTTATELTQMENDMKRAYAKLQNSVIPFDDGYYYIEPSQKYLLDMGLKDDDGLACWTYLQEGNGDFIWKLQYDSDNQSYYLTNIHSDGSISNIVKNEPVSVNSSVDQYDYRVMLEYADYDETLGFSYTIRHANTEGTYVYLSRYGSDDNGSSGSYTIGGTADAKASGWRLVKVNDQLVENLIASYAQDKAYNDLNTRVTTIYGKSQKVLFNMTDPLNTYNDPSMIPTEQVNTLKTVMSNRPNPDTEQYYQQLLTAYNDVLDHYTDLNAVQEFYNDNLDLVGYYSAGKNPGQYDSTTVSNFEKAMDSLAYVICHTDGYKLKDFTALRSDAKQKRDLIPASGIPYEEGQYRIVSPLWFDEDAIKAVSQDEDDQLLWATPQDEDQDQYNWNLTYDATHHTYQLCRNGYTLFGGDLTFTGLHYDKTGGTQITIHRSTDTGKYLHLANYGNGYNENGSVDTGLDGSRTQSSLWLLTKIDEKVDPSATMRLTSAQWGTFVAPFDVTIPDGVQAFTGTLQAQQWIKLDEITGTIPANTPVVVYSQGLTETRTWPFYGTETSAQGLASCFTGNTSNPYDLAKGDYALQKNNNLVGWYQVGDEQVQVGKNRCYLCKDKVTQARTYFAMSTNDQPTSIVSIQTQAQTMPDGKYMVGGRIITIRSGKAYDINATEIHNIE